MPEKHLKSSHRPFQRNPLLAYFLLIPLSCCYVGTAPSVTLAPSLKPSTNLREI